jgi:hypothetical protein
MPCPLRVVIVAVSAVLVALVAFAPDAPADCPKRGDSAVEARARARLNDVLCTF